MKRALSSGRRAFRFAGFWLQYHGGRIAGVLRRATYALRIRRLPTSERFPLAAAAAAGSTDLIERLLEHGADVNAQNRYGWTPLHEAVICGKSATAARLLARGANADLRDRGGHTALELAQIETLHAIRQHYTRIAGVQPVEAKSEVAVAWAKDLSRNGIVRLSGLLTDDELAQLKTNFQASINEIDARLALPDGGYQRFEEEGHWRADQQLHLINNPYKHSTPFARLCCNADLLEAMRLYFGKHAFVHAAQAYRYLPREAEDDEQFHWHIDSEEQSLKIMVLLTDVRDDDQYMTYVLGSHQLLHPLSVFRREVTDLAYCRKQLGEPRLFNATGKAGDIFLFDTNGVHRGNRSDTARVRDAYFAAFVAHKSYVWGGDIDARAFDGLAFDGPNPLEQMQSAPKMWELPPGQARPTWTAMLVRPETWL